MDNNKALHICGIRVDLVQISEVVSIMSSWIEKMAPGNYIVLSNAYDAVLSMRDQKLNDAVKYSSLSVPDGGSLLLAARLYGKRLNKRVYGPDLLIEFIKSTQNKDYKHFFYGATENTINKMIDKLKEQFPGLNISGTYASI